jgi:hypothetical protein
MSQSNQSEQILAKLRVPETESDEISEQSTTDTAQSTLGNRTLQRLLTQRVADNDGAFTLDENTEARINGERGNGMSLDNAIQAKMGAATGHDFSGVRVHTSPESHALNEQLSAKAFTTGQDIFFRAGEYNPGSSGGQELLAHELTHVVQQGTGRVGGGSGGMTVNAPGDAFEQEADAMSKHVTSSPASGEAAGLQRAEMPEEEELQTKALQRADAPPEEEELQMQAMPEEEEEVQMQEMPEEEEMPA